MSLAAFTFAEQPHRPLLGRLTITNGALSEEDIRNNVHAALRKCDPILGARAWY